MLSLIFLLLKSAFVMWLAFGIYLISGLGLSEGIFGLLLITSVWVISLGICLVELSVSIRENIFDVEKKIKTRLAKDKA